MCVDHYEFRLGWVWVWVWDLCRGREVGLEERGEEWMGDFIESGGGSVSWNGEQDVWMQDELEVRTRTRW